MRQHQPPDRSNADVAEAAAADRSGEELNSPLKRTLTRPQLILYGLGTTIGAGIYALLGEIANISGYLAPWAFVLAGLLAGFTGLSFAVLSSRYPRAAGSALYVQKSFNAPRLATAAGLLVMFAGVVSAATLLNGFVGYAQEFLHLERNTVIALAAVCITMLAVWGISQSVWLAAAITLLEIGGLLWATGLAGLSVQAPDFSLFITPPQALVTPPQALVTPPQALPDGAGAGAALAVVISGAVLAFYAFIGFEDMVEVAEEVRDVKHAMPAAIIITLCLTTLLYGVLMVAALLAVGPGYLADSSAPLPDLFRALGHNHPRVISFIGALAIINGALIQVIMASRVFYGLASRGQLPAILARVNPTTRTPWLATLLSGTAILLLALAGNLVLLAELTSVLILLVFTLVNAALFNLQRRAAGRRAVLQVSSLIGAAACLALVFYTLSGWLT